MVAETALVAYLRVLGFLQEAPAFAEAHSVGSVGELSYLANEVVDGGDFVLDN